MPGRDCRLDCRTVRDCSLLALHPKVGVQTTLSVLQDYRSDRTVWAHRPGSCVTVGSTKLKRWYLIVSRTQENSRQLVWAIVLSLGMLLSACSWVPKGAPQLDVGIEDRGVASWYGGSFHGKQAANGERFDMEGLTAAHRTLPLGSVVRVVNLANGKYLHVRITDRGPYVNNRILDLSRGAAARLGMVEVGLSHVRVQLVGERRPAALLSSDAMKTASVALILGPEQARSGTAQPCCP